MFILDPVAEWIWSPVDVQYSTAFIVFLGLDSAMLACNVGSIILSL